MECSQSKEHSKLLFLTIEKEILRDISAGIFNEIYKLMNDNNPNANFYEYLKVIARYADNLRKICE